MHAHGDDPVASTAAPANQTMCQKPATTPTNAEACATAFARLTSSEVVERRL